MEIFSSPTLMNNISRLKNPHIKIDMKEEDLRTIKIKLQSNLLWN